MKHNYGHNFTEESFIKALYKKTFNVFLQTPESGKYTQSSPFREIKRFSISQVHHDHQNRQDMSKYTSELYNIRKTRFIAKI